MTGGARRSAGMVLDQGQGLGCPSSVAGTQRQAAHDQGPQRRALRKRRARVDESSSNSADTEAQSHAAPDSSIRASSAPLRSPAKPSFRKGGHQHVHHPPAQQPLAPAQHHPPPAPDQQPVFVFQPPPDPWQWIPQQLVRINQTTEQKAQAAMRDVLAANPTLNQPQKHQKWLEDASHKLALWQETEDLRAAMAASLAEAEAARMAQQEQEDGDSLLGMMRQHRDSSVLRQLQEVVCPALLLRSPAKPALEALLDMERKCKKWYSSRGTTHYFSTLAEQLRATFSDVFHAAQARNAEGDQQPSPCPSPCRDLARKPVGPTTGPVLRCVQPCNPCPLCGAASPGGETGPAGGDAAAGQDMGEAGSPEDREGKPPFLHHQPHLRPAFQQLQQHLQDQVALIQAEVCKMPPTAPACPQGGGAPAGGVSVWVPELFRLPPGVQLEPEEVVYLSSDTDEG